MTLPTQWLWLLLALMCAGAIAYAIAYAIHEFTGTHTHRCPVCDFDRSELTGQAQGTSLRSWEIVTVNCWRCPKCEATWQE